MDATTERAFVGRAAELKHVWTSIAKIRRGRGSVILIGGPPGIGKTSLAAEIARRGRDSGLLVGWGRSWEGGGAPAYWPWSQCVTVLLRRLERKALEGFPVVAMAHIAQLVPEIRKLADEVPALPPLEADHARFALLEAVAKLLDHLGKRSPLLVVLDDLHACDIPSLLLLQFLARHGRDVPAGVVGTYRTVGAAAADAEAATLLARIAGEVETMALGGLNAHDVGEILQQHLGRSLEAGLVRDVHAATNRNPLLCRRPPRPWGSKNRAKETRLARACDCRLE